MFRIRLNDVLLFEATEDEFQDEFDIERTQFIEVYPIAFGD